MNGECERIEHLIIDYSLGELDSSESAAVEEHVKTCPRCSEALGEVRRAVSGLSHCEMVEPPAALCEGVREAVWKRAFGRRTVFSVIAGLAESFVRRPVLAGASALVLIGAAILLFVTLGPRSPEEKPDGITRIDIRARVLRELRDYLSESEELMSAALGTKGREALASHDKDYWLLLIANAMELRERRPLDRHSALLSDLEGLYRRILACGGKVDQEKMDGIRQLIAEKRLKERTGEAIELER